MILTDENYHSPEANKEYMSVSQYKTFLTCEALGMALTRKEYDFETSDAMLVGQYVHAWSEGTLEKFKEQNANKIFSKAVKKENVLLAKFQQAEEIIEVIKNDKVLMTALSGDKEIIVTTDDFLGYPWKIKIDNLNVKKGYFSDLKVIASLYDRNYNVDAGKYLSFVEHYKYDLQMLAYAMIEKQANKREKPLEPYLVVVTKETPSDRAILKGFLDDTSANDLMLYEVSQNMQHIQKVKEGKEIPRSCEKCVYCRRVKKTSVFHYKTLI